MSDDDDDDDEDPPAGPNRETPNGKAPSKGSKTSKSASIKEPIEEPNAEVVMDDAVNTAGEDVYLKSAEPKRTYTMSITKTKAAWYEIAGMKDMVPMLWSHTKVGLFHLNDSDIVDFIVALRMFTRSLIIKRQVEDLQLDVESYQKKLNITAP
ncbi:hypothetical protein Tco_0583373 [Tanacetum coccineum]